MSRQQGNQDMTVILTNHQLGNKDMTVILTNHQLGNKDMTVILTILQCGENVMIVQTQINPLQEKDRNHQKTNHHVIEISPNQGAENIQFLLPDENVMILALINLHPDVRERTLILTSRPQDENIRILILICPLLAETLRDLIQISHHQGRNLKMVIYPLRVVLKHPRSKIVVFSSRGSWPVVAGQIQMTRVGRPPCLVGPRQDCLQQLTWEKRHWNWKRKRRTCLIRWVIITGVHDSWDRLSSSNPHYFCDVFVSLSTEILWTVVCWQKSTTQIARKFGLVQRRIEPWNLNTAHSVRWQFMWVLGDCCHSVRGPGLNHCPD